MLEIGEQLVGIRHLDEGRATRRPARRQRRRGETRVAGNDPGFAGAVEHGASSLSFGRLMAVLNLAFLDCMQFCRYQPRDDRKSLNNDAYCMQYPSQQDAR
jgi:hypothetical protein